ncbi:GAF domain-containing protein [Nonomuraea sp. K274]|uniref:GAF domain-containing protein n=1 Tax=Nonomuraea cypriaca TaxID=1187855 RepID=A0A931A6T7_9ACTN|nr:ATP-binding protein [Nonomuraea cypriaca]MBF8184454.1 GAF domain-containing protein [Nonomuraea cypriaca]
MADDVRPGRACRGTPRSGWDAVQVLDARTLLEQTPDGVAVIDQDGRFLQANPAALSLCGLDAADVAGAASPFPPCHAGDVHQDAETEAVTVWEAASGLRREFAFRTRRLTDRGERLVAFRDVTESRRHQRRLAAIASAASRVAAKRSLSSTLDALAKEVLEADALASVQILTVNAGSERFRVMGTAGFGQAANFFDLLVECLELGAELRMIDAFTTREPVVVPHRYATIMSDPAWKPLKDYMRAPEWDWFASVPLMVRGEPVGILNAYFAPGQEITRTALDFLLAMAEQAAQAVDYAALLEREREVARREERQRLARDLHDSVVQQVFSMGMQVESLGMQSRRDAVVDSAYVVRVAGELGHVSKAVLNDLRAMVTDLHPTTHADQGLSAALVALAESTMARTGFDVQVSIADPHDELDDVEAELQEDAYRVIAEALHNSVKHSHGSLVTVDLRLTRRGTQRWLTGEVADNGRGLPAQNADSFLEEGGFGMTAMKERAGRWAGDLTTRSSPGNGTTVCLVLPLPPSLPTGLASETARRRTTTWTPRTS